MKLNVHFKDDGESLQKIVEEYLKELQKEM